MIIQSSGRSLALSVVVCLHLLAGLDHQHQAAAAGRASIVSSAKNYMVGLVKSKIIDWSQLARSFKEAKQRVGERYDQAAARGELARMDETQQTAFRYRLVVEELHRLRARFESAQMNLDSEGSSSGTTSSYNREPSAGKKQVVDKKPKGGWSLRAPDFEDDDDDDDEEEDLDDLEDLNDLDNWDNLEELERQAAAEDEMGLSMSPEVQEMLRKRTKLVVSDLLNNEIRQLALSVLNAYMTGGPMGGLVTAISASLKLKLVEYLMNAAIDIINSLMGRQIEIKPVEAITASPFQPVTGGHLSPGAQLAV